MKYPPSSPHCCYCIHHLCIHSLMLLALIMLMFRQDEVHENEALE